MTPNRRTAATATESPSTRPGRSKRRSTAPSIPRHDLPTPSLRVVRRRWDTRRTERRQASEMPTGSNEAEAPSFWGLRPEA